MLRRAIALSAIIAVALSTASVALAACQMQCGSVPIRVASAAPSIVSGDAHAHMHHAAMHHPATHMAMPPNTADLQMSSSCQVHADCPVAKAKVQEAALNPAERRVQHAGLPSTKLQVVDRKALVEPGPLCNLTHPSQPSVITPLRI